MPSPLAGKNGEITNMKGSPAGVIVILEPRGAAAGFREPITDERYARRRVSQRMRSEFMSHPVSIV